MSASGLFGEIVTVADSLRGNAVVLFGPYAGMITLACQGMAAAVALLLLGAGTRLWAPPAQALPNLAPRTAALLSLVIILQLYLSVQNPQGTVTPLRVAIWSTGALLVFGTAYIVSYQLLTFRCPGIDTLYVRGFFLTRDAKQVLNNVAAPLPTIRTITGAVRPTDPQNYFCRADRERPELIWTKPSLDAAKLLLSILYIPFAISIIVLLAATAFALQLAQTKVYELPDATVARIPADLLFEFGVAKLKHGAEVDLQQIADLIKVQRKSGAIVISGHTDSLGTESANLKLSEDRARSVAQWLATQGKLATVKFDLQGLGENQPRVPNTFPDGSDNPEGRRLNRRVEVSIPSERPLN